jgi:roadblock/LC7 domain-containing protein
MLTKGKAFLMKRVTISLPKSDAAVPGLAGIIRLVIMGVLGLLVIFPFACLLHYKSIESLNQSKRDAYIQEYIEDAGKSFNAQTALIKKSILEIENQLKANVGIYQEDGLLKEKKQELVRLNHELASMTAANQVEFEQNLSKYRDQISERYFIVLSFNAVTKYSFFIVAFALVLCFLVMPHLFLYRLKTNPKFLYSKLSTDFYKGKIDHEYHETNNWIVKYLKEQFDYEPQGFHKNIYWENPPYCTIRKEIFAKRTIISSEEFLTNLDQNNI